MERGIFYPKNMRLVNKISLLIIVITSIFTVNTYAQFAKTVAKDGTGDYLTVQAAIE